MAAARISHGSPASDLANSAASPEKLPVTVAGMPIACSRRGDGGDRVAQRIAGREIEADGDGGELLLMRDRQRRGGAVEMREGRQRHLVVAGDGVGRRGGVGVGGADGGVGDGGRRAGRGGRAGDVELRQRSRVVLVARLRLQHHAVLVGLAVDGGNLPLAEGVVERVGHALHGDAEAAGLLAVDLHHDARAALLRLGGDVAQRGDCRSVCVSLSAHSAPRRASVTTSVY